jgi:hypothetical protein
MAYIGLQPQQKTVATSTEQFSGNASTLEFTLSRAVSKAADLLVFVGTSVKIPEVDYTAYNNTLLFTSPPASGTNNINVSFKAGALTTITLGANSFPVGSTVAPSIRSADAVSTGIYWPTTTSLGLTVSGNTRVTITNQPTATNTSTGALIVSGGAGISGALYVGGTLAATATTQATNATSGALIVSGGAGVAKNMFVGGSISVAGDFTVAGTFTTTGQDSLAVTDPFIFLANTNVGDSLDIGVIGTYNDGTQRFTGFFRDVTDGDFKLFENLTVQPTTVVDTSSASFSYADLVVGNITATNLIGNVANSASITSVGNLTSLSVSGSIKGYNINYLYNTTASTSTTTGALQISGGVGVVGNINAGNVSATYIIGNGSLLTGLPAGYSNTNVSSYLPTYTGAFGNITGITSSGIIQTTGIVYANANVESADITTGALVVKGGIGVSGNINATAAIFGNVGIGTASPTSKLDVSGGYITTANSQLSFGNILSTTASLVAGNWYRIATFPATNTGQDVEIHIRHGNTHNNTVIKVAKGTGQWRAEVYRAGYYVNPTDNAGYPAINKVRVYDIGVNSATHIDVQILGNTGSQTYNVIVKNNIADQTVNRITLVGFTDQGTTPAGIEFQAIGTMASWGNNGGQCVTFNENGNVGIGTSSPAYKLQVVGSFAATTKSFLIDHPTKEGMKLRYGSLESPYHGVRLTGEGVLINGTATVKLPDYIHGLCKQEGSQVQITNIKHGKVIWVDDVNVDEDCFVVKSDTLVHDESEYKFYWSFTAIRKDIEDMIVEFAE